MSASNLPVPVFLGFCAKEIGVPEWWSKNTWGAHILEPASVSDCCSDRAPDWIDRWDFNRSTFWNEESLALAVVPAERLPHFRLYCYRLFPILFGASDEPKGVSVDEVFPDGLPGLPDEPDLSHYWTLGYDIVERPLAPSSVLSFGCSPLFCNGMAEEIAVNRYCLVDDLDNAFAIAKRFGTEQPEPGPYVIVEVLKRS